MLHIALDISCFFFMFFSPSLKTLNINYYRPSLLKEETTTVKQKKKPLLLQERKRLPDNKRPITLRQQKQQVLKTFWIGPNWTLYSSKDRVRSDLRRLKNRLPKQGGKQSKNEVNKVLQQIRDGDRVLQLVKDLPYILSFVECLFSVINF